MRACWAIVGTSRGRAYSRSIRSRALRRCARLASSCGVMPRPYHPSSDNPADLHGRPIGPTGPQASRSMPEKEPAPEAPGTHQAGPVADLGAGGNSVDAHAGTAGEQTGAGAVSPAMLAV